MSHKKISRMTVLALLLAHLVALSVASAQVGVTPIGPTSERGLTPRTPPPAG